MNDSVTLAVTIDCPCRELYEAFWPPEAFPRWASGLSRSRLMRQGNRWRADGPEGSVLIRFSPYNAFGVMDHWVELTSGAEVYIPLRVVANGFRAEVMLTLFRPGGGAEAETAFQRDVEWVRKDLLTLQALAEGGAVV
ncbi:polyketide cyclase [Salinicola rhizosphaerae]|uniref:Polyketide cyclase n=1 Tax=Salinicola rhizosphaerae TaxID=1443141 RepID=A0ABQ3E186_9GAMM|nr:polyketide cyclase [Salinicola rhizosphaerae]GHB22372.1 polyketide cyclase [Salinicola rhizosphaerae]